MRIPGKGGKIAEKRANVSHVANDKAPNVAELDPQRICSRFKKSCRYLTDLALTGNESRPQCRRKVSLGDAGVLAPPCKNAKAEWLRLLMCP